MTRQTATAVLSFILLLWAFPLAAETRYVAGHDDVPLAVTEIGPEDGPEILFLHGIGMGAESFAPQLQSDLAEKYRMVAFDLRGHGMSGKPSDAEAYTQRKVWAGDVERVIAATGLKRPVVVAWSYGTLVAADYLLVNDSDAISGLILVSALGGLVPPSPPDTPPDADVMAQMARYYALRQSVALADQQESVAILAPLLFEQNEEGPSELWRERAAILGLMVPPYAQPHLRAHPSENTALVGKLTKTPIMVVRGVKDFAVNPADVEALERSLPQVQELVLDPGGHSPFAERPEAFNAALSAFTDENWSTPNDQ